MVRDFGPQYGEHIRLGQVIVDSIENIGANKLTAILGRTEPKDFVDLYFILLRAGSIDVYSVRRGTKRYLGLLHPSIQAGSLRQVRRVGVYCGE